MNKKDLKAVLLASALGGAAFVAPVMAEENSQDPVDVNDQTTQTVPADESTVNEQTTNTESAETDAVKDGWSDDGYYYENGQMVVSQFKVIDTKTYYFKWDGSFYKDGAYYIGSDQYYFDVNGVMQTNFEYENKYFGEDGKAVSMQWVQFGNKWRYYGADTTYCTGQFVYMNDEFYAFDDDGFALSGWQKIGDYWYYLTEKGLSLTNQWVDGNMYYVDADGKMVTNRWIDNSSYVGADGKKTVNTWEQVNGKYKYKLGDGTYATQRLILDKGKYYAVDYDGYMVTDDTAYVSNYNAIGDSVFGTVHAGKDGVLVKGWYTNSSKTTYYFGDNYFAYGTGLYTIEGKQYYFQYESLVKSRSFVYDGKVYSSDANGVVTLTDTTGQTKWVQLNGAWYYLKDGVALTNTLEEIDGSYYYFNNEGIMLSSQTFEYDNHKYYVDSNGVVAMKKNTWAQTDNGQTIYYKEDGGLVYDTTFTIDNKLYKFSYEGYLERGTVSVYDRDGTKYYLTDESGVINQTAGWKEYRFHWYYAKEDGALYTNELTIIGGKSYYFNYSGEMVVNSAQYVGDGLYYFDTNGELVDSVDSFTGTKEFHGLIYLNKDGDRYYTGEYGGRYYSGGVLQQSCIVEDKYYIDFNGKIAKGWIKDGNTYYYGDPTTGVLAKNKWLQINGTWYYFNYFTMATGYCYADDGLYQFSESGAMIGKAKPDTWYRDSYTNLWKYIQSDGTVFDGPKLVVNGTTYYFAMLGKGGAMGFDGLAENCVWYDNETGILYWTNATGTGFDTKDGWKKSADGELGYVENGKVVTGFKMIDGKGYYFWNNGYLAKGVTNYKGKAYVIDENGNLVDYQEGWNTLGNESFYIKNGVALMDTFVDGNFIGGNGLTYTGIYYGSNSNNVALVHGKLAKNQWIESNNSKCYVDEKGHMLRNQWIDNHYVDRYGYMVKDAWVGNYYVDANGDYKPNGSTSQETKAEWKQLNGKWWYQHKDGTCTENDFETISGQTYYFDGNGYMVTGWKEINNKLYFFNASGVMAKNVWQGAYYLGSDGVMLTNAFTPDGYYVGSDGAYVRNQKVTVDGKTYYLNADGKVAKNQWSGDYYLDGNGNVVKNRWVGNYWCGEDGKYVKSSWVDNHKYYVGSNGIYVTNQWVGDYYLNGAGLVTKNAWVGSYWCGEDGKYVKSSWVDNNKYYVGSNGVYVTNQWVGDYYLNGAGLVTKNAWVGDYWCGSDGKYVKNAWVGSYWCGEDGKYVKSSWVDNNKYYVGSNGIYVTNQWVGDYYLNGAGLVTKNAWVGSYWCGEDGKYVKSSWVDNGKYYVGSNGVYVTNQWVGDYYLNGAGLVTKNAWVGNYWCGSDGKYVKSAWVDNNRYYVNENGVYVAGAWEQDSKGWKYHAGNVYAKSITLNINGTSYTFDSNGYMK